MVVGLSDLPRAAEVEARAFYRRDFRGDQACVHLQIVRGVDLQLRLPAVFPPGEVEVHVARGGVDRVGVAVALEVQAQGAAPDAVSHRGAESAGEAVVPVRGTEREAHRVVQHLGRPLPLVIGVGSAVELIRPLVCRQHVLFAAQREARERDAVAVAPDGGAEVGRTAEVALRAVIARHALPAAKAQARHRGAQRRDRDGELARLDRIQRVRAEIRFCDHFAPPYLYHFNNSAYYNTGPGDLQLTNIVLVFPDKLCYTDNRPIPEKIIRRSA